LGGEHLYSSFFCEFFELATPIADSRLGLDSQLCLAKLSRRRARRTVVIVGLNFQRSIEERCSSENFEHAGFSLFAV
jgi:hypothetical protein